ncbi:hypothetical protein GWI33_006559 [Rhynchophorus ferrugineus]|uniref:Uncharacterized protein n=1 Tax=Rhynchophorus ferrugineus TaxID=354439 RepID=A0A834ITU9_RHYFE|nr:hypothetical protein GWI33_006559 [Rhynchophorus ferrugineus]
MIGGRVIDISTQRGGSSISGPSRFQLPKDFVRRDDLRQYGNKDKSKGVQNDCKPQQPLHPSYQIHPTDLGNLSNYKRKVDTRKKDGWTTEEDVLSASQITLRFMSDDGSNGLLDGLEL